MNLMLTYFGRHYFNSNAPLIIIESTEWLPLIKCHQRAAFDLRLRADESIKERCAVRMYLLIVFQCVSWSSSNWEPKIEFQTMEHSQWGIQTTKWNQMDPLGGQTWAQSKLNWFLATIQWTLWLWINHLWCALRTLWWRHLLLSVHLSDPKNF